VIEAIGKYAQGESLNALDGFLPRLPVGKNAGDLGNFGQPAPIVFLLNLDG